MAAASRMLPSDWSPAVQEGVVQRERELQQGRVPLQHPGPVQQVVAQHLHTLLLLFLLLFLLLSISNYERFTIINRLYEFTCVVSQKINTV